MKAKWVLLLISLLFLTACTFLKEERKENLQSVVPQDVVRRLANATISREKELIVVHKEERKKTESVLKWKATSVDKTIIHPLSVSDKKYKLSIIYDTVELYQVVTSVLHDVLKKNFALEGKLDNTVSVTLQGEFTEKELIDFLSFILESSGYSLIADKGTFYIKPQKTAPQAALFSGFSWWFYKPKFLPPKDIAKLLSALKSNEGVVQVFKNNALLVIDDKERVRSFRALVSLIDVDVFSGYEFRIFKLQYSEPSELKKELEESLQAVGLKPKEIYTLIPVDRLSYLICVAKSGAIADKIESLVKILDAPSEVSEKRVYIYKVQHVEVKKLAKTLRDFLSGKEEVKATKKGKAKTSQRTVVVKGGVIIVPDPVTNSLLIEATPRDYEKIKRIITELDSMPKQVLIEVLIAEVSLEKELEYGIEWWLRVHADTFTSTAAISYGLEGAKKKLIGFTYYGIDPEHFWNFMYFLTTNSKVNVLSSPHIIVRDNQKAKIDVGKEVPILTLETVGNTQIEGTSAIDRRVEYRDVGVILEVKPHISEEGFVTLEVMEETSTPEPNTVSGIDSPIISKRKVTTTLMVKNGHTVVIGGIIDTRREKIKKSVPILSNIPLIGPIFSYERNHVSRTELIVMLTPYVIGSVNEADIITSAFQSRLRELVESSPKNARNKKR